MDAIHINSLQIYIIITVKYLIKSNLSSLQLYEKKEVVCLIKVCFNVLINYFKFFMNNFRELVIEDVSYLNDYFYLITINYLKGTSFVLKR